MPIFSGGFVVTARIIFWIVETAASQHALDDVSMSGAIPAIGKRLPVREVRPAILGGLFGSRYAISIRTFGDLHCFLLRDPFHCLPERLPEKCGSAYPTLTATGLGELFLYLTI